MRRDRLATLVHVRELVERRRLAVQAAARRQLDAAAAAHRESREALAGAAIDGGTSLSPTALVLHHAGGVALGDAAEAHQRAVVTATRTHERAEQRVIGAAKDRKAAERLQERRAEVIAVERERTEQRRMDELGLTVWRRGR